MKFSDQDDAEAVEVDEASEEVDEETSEVGEADRPSRTSGKGPVWARDPDTGQLVRDTTED